MLSKQILVIGETFTSFQSIRKILQNGDTDVSYAMSVKQLLGAVSLGNYCLIVMCIRTLKNDAVKVLQNIRELFFAPIIVIAPKLNIHNKIMLFHAGANACWEEPIDEPLFAAQTHSFIQLYLDAKKADSKEHPLIFGTELIVNPIYRHVIINGEPLELTRTEFDLFYFMAKHPNQIFSRQQLYHQVWKDDLAISGKNTVRSHIGNLYKKLADVGKNYIQNARGVGYRFVPPAGVE